MLLSDIFDHLNYGELAQLHIAGAESTGIAAENYPAVVSHLNMALIELYKRLPLSIKSIELKESSSISTYYLQEKYATNSGSGEPTLYLLDSATDKFTGDVLKIERITSDDEDEEGNLPLNDINNSESRYTVGYDGLELFEPDDSTTLTIYYRAKPTKIVATNLNPATTDIPIPDSLLEALVLFMAARAHANVPSLDGQPTDTTMYLQKFEASLRRVEEQSLIENNNTQNQKLYNNGWV